MELEEILEKSKMTEEQRDSILDQLDMYGERHFFFNEENYPEKLAYFTDDVIVRCCNSLSKKIYDRTESEYADWVKNQNSGIEDERKYRSLQEQYEHLYCDTRLLPDPEDPYWDSH